MRILLADDEPAYSALVEAVLGASGYEVVVAWDGREAWEVLTGTDPPQLALLDWSMPRMDGLDVCREARKHPDTRSSYFILLTGRDRDEDLIEATEAGVDDFFTKGSSMNALLLRVRVGRRIIELQNRLANAGETVSPRSVPTETGGGEL